MIDSMTKYSFILLNGEQEGFLETLRDTGLVDITRSEKPVDEFSAAILGKADSLSHLMAELDKAPLWGCEPAPLPEGCDLEALAKKSLDRLDSLSDALKEADKEAVAAEPWGAFSPERISALTEAGYTLSFHSCRDKVFKEEWADEYPLEIINQVDGRTYFVTVLPAGEEDVIPDKVPAPTRSLEAVQAEIARLEKEIDGVKGILRSIRDRKPELEAACKERLSELDMYLAEQGGASAAENTLVTYVGYASVKDEETVSAAVDKTGALWFKEAAKVEDNPPIKFRNNRFVRMFEVLTDMYGRPAYDGFDPTPFIAVFFLLFFAFCMGDAGYGLILIIAGLLLRKVDSFKSLSPLVVTLGVGTAIIGFLFHNFFSMDISEWSIFAPIKGIFLPSKIMGYDGTMVLAIIVGVLHICLALIVKTFIQTKNKGFLESLGAWGWMLLIVGGIIVAGISFAGVIGATATKWVVIVLGVISALGIFIFNDIHRSPLKNIGAGLWETYNTATGLIGDVLSYLRLYALGLAGSMLGLAFNNIGQMILGDGSNFVLWIPFVLIVVIGHTLNIAMAALGAFVHPLRLNFLEFFKNSGYEGVGRIWRPLSK